MHINLRAASDTPERKRALIRRYRGVPWWGLILFYVVFCAIGMLASLGTKEIGTPFFVVFLLCAAIAPLIAEVNALFTAAVSPVLSYTLAILIYYLLERSVSEQKGMRTLLLKIAIPYLSGVPYMLAAFVIAVVLVSIRIIIFGSRNGWESLWINSVVRSGRKAEAAASSATKRARTESATTASSRSASRSSSRNENRAKNSSSESPRARRITVPTTESEPAVSVTTTTTPRPRPVAHSESASMPRYSDTSRTTSRTNTPLTGHGIPSTPPWRDEAARRPGTQHPQMGVRVPTRVVIDPKTGERRRVPVDPRMVRRRQMTAQGRNGARPTRTGDGPYPRNAMPRRSDQRAGERLAPRAGRTGQVPPHRPNGMPSTGGAATGRPTNQARYPGSPRRAPMPSGGFAQGGAPRRADNGVPGAIQPRNAVRQRSGVQGMPGGASVAGRAFPGGYPGGSSGRPSMPGRSGMPGRGGQPSQAPYSMGRPYDARGNSTPVRSPNQRASRQRSSRYQSDGDNPSARN